MILDQPQNRKVATLGYSCSKEVMEFSSRRRRVLRLMYSSLLPEGRDVAGNMSGCFYPLLLALP
jgi:hypothetical protein